jgi:hypothetical protein
MLACASNLTEKDARTLNYARAEYLATWEGVEKVVCLAKKLIR